MAVHRVTWVGKQVAPDGFALHVLPRGGEAHRVAHDEVGDGVAEFVGDYVVEFFY